MLTFIHSSYFRNLLDGFSVGAILMNAGGRVYAANLAASAILGFGKERFLRPGIFEEISSRLDSPAEFQGMLQSLLQGQGGAHSLRLTYNHPSRGRLHLDISSNSLIESDKVFGILLEFNDITEIINLAEREKKMLTERARLQREHIQSLYGFSEAVAHQIRNPCMTIGGMANLMLKRKPEDDPDCRLLDNILHGAQRLEAIVEAVHSFTKPIQPKPERVRLATIINRARKELGGLVERARWQTPAKSPVIVTDPAWAAQAVGEALRNALEALPAEGGEIRISWRVREGNLVLEIADNGHGLAPQSLCYLFDPFFTTKAVGVGMGLCRARRILNKLGGEISLRPGLDQGALASIVLPVRGPIASPVENQQT
ncbi:hypothetical protein AAU61_14575 [Desulfocarbo indianensis]|nr:hypothetical protein AAU61_14575 [Desulfocarbo indianensis]